MKIFFVGIKGVGMSGLAVIAKQQGFEVSGCDSAEVFITDKILSQHHIKVKTGFDREIKDVDLVIYTGAHQGKNNPAVLSAIANKIRVLNYAQGLRELAGLKKIIAVAGTHGKTTTTAMIAKALTDAGLDPGYLIGTGNVPDLGGNGHWGRGDYFVAEADEYVADPTDPRSRPKFLYLNPYVGLVLSTEYDHPDVFKTPKLYQNAYKKFVKRILPQGLAIIRGDEKSARKIIKSAESKTKVKKIFFNQIVPGINLKISGQYNLFNANATFYACRFLGVNPQLIKKSLNSFSGLERRMELKFNGKTNGVKIYDDYAHHPTEIKEALKNLRSQYNNHRIIVVFQSHTVSRTKVLLADFAQSFKDVDMVIVAPIFLSAREAKSDFTEIDLACEIQKFHKNCISFSSQSEIIDFLQKQVHDGDIIITMGAGDIYKLISNLKI